MVLPELSGIPLVQFLGRASVTLTEIFCGFLESLKVNGGA
jgi:hypothetical protein